MSVKTFADGSHYADPHYKDESELIAVGVLESNDGITLVDPGPQISLQSLLDILREEGLSREDIKHVLVTHIHLDHAGGVGHLVSELPDVTVYVHEIGAPHVADPARLLSSARRIYGDAMEGTWGTMRPVARDQIEVVDDQDVLKIGERRFHVKYTPGHAKHHVSYIDEGTGYAFVGDVAGQKTTGVPYVMPVTPPPDVDLSSWSESLTRIEESHPEGLFLTHFGPSTQPVKHIETMRRRLKSWSDRVREDLGTDASDGDLAEAFEEEKLNHLANALPEEDQRPYRLFAHPEGSWHGIARYWRNL